KRRDRRNRCFRRCHGSSGARGGVAGPETGRVRYLARGGQRDPGRLIYPNGSGQIRRYHSCRFWRTGQCIGLFPGDGGQGMTQVAVKRFKQALQNKEPQLGLWTTLCSPYAAEIVARAGFDWLLFDMEHSPSEITTVLGQLQAAAPYPVTPIVRPTWKDVVQQ